MNKIKGKYSSYFLKVLWFMLSLFILNPKAYSQQPIKAFRFCDIKWHKKISKKPTGPGNNLFGIHKRNISIDKNGHVNLKIKKVSNGYSCAEIYSDSLFREGIYEMTIITNTKHFSDQMVLGMFLYDETTPPHHNEIDIEIAKWGKKNNENSQFVVYNESNLSIHRFFIPEKKILTKHIINITNTNKQILVSSSFYNKDTEEYDKIEEHSFNKPDEYEFKKVRFHFNLWLTDTQIKNAGKNPKVKITSFKYTPNYTR